MDRITATNTQRAGLPSEIRAVIRYADPSTWPIVITVHELLQKNHIDFKKEGIHTGLILVGDSGPREATQSVIDTVKEGAISPMRFAAANAAAAIGVCATVFHFHGPTLAITLPVNRGELIAKIIASQWLDEGIANITFIITYQTELRVTTATSTLLVNE